MPIVNLIARPVPTPYIQWTGDNAEEIQTAVNGSGGGPWTVTDNGDGTLTVSNPYMASEPIPTGHWISVGYPQSGVDYSFLDPYFQALPGDGPYQFGITES